MSIVRKMIRITRRVLPDCAFNQVRKLKPIFMVPPMLYQNQKNIRRNKEKTQMKLRNGQKVQVIFLAQFPEMWNSSKTVFECLRKCKKADVIVYAVPKKDADGQYQCNDMLAFCESQGIPAVNTFQNGAFRQISPDVDFIFVQRPYDDFMPDCYRLEPLSRKGLVCYIPYNNRLTIGFHLRCEMNDELLSCFYSLFADCAEANQFVKRWMNRYCFTQEKNVYQIGSPRYDLFPQKTAHSDKKANTFLWLPRWSLDAEHNSSHFLNYIDVLLEYFEHHPDAALVIRPHPLMFQTFLKEGAMKAEEIEQLRQRVDRAENISFDENKDYLYVFAQSDFLISDVTSLLHEFYLTGKPVIICDDLSTDPLTAETEKMLRSFYKADSAEALLKKIEALLSGNDEKKAVREKNLRERSSSDGKCGQRIVKALFRDVMK